MVTVLGFSNSHANTWLSSLTSTQKVSIVNFLQFVMKKKELIPLITFVSFAGIGAAYKSIYSLFKTDVIVNRQKNPEPWENTNPYKPQKIFTINQKWEPLEELKTVKQLTK
uniref:Uncharacterized protein n=1 Tax=Vombatus ursinus TaxID=29139 RepID=A0A4X2K122_VOMUR